MGNFFFYMHRKQETKQCMGHWLRFFVVVVLSRWPFLFITSQYGLCIMQTKTAHMQQIRITCCTQSFYITASIYEGCVTSVLCDLAKTGKKKEECCNMLNHLFNQTFDTCIHTLYHAENGY